ncbi:MAG: hypothetical protein LBN39_06905 [Planctomycetaceae bacterium]|nr:hypothetical protein [Planctomycetaceae bacterium]
MLPGFLRNIRFNVRQAIFCGLLAAHLFAFVALPVLHHHSEHHSEQTGDCSICDAIHSTVLQHQQIEPLYLFNVSEYRRYSRPAKLTTFKAAVLPPCRAPPVLNG